MAMMLKGYVSNDNFLVVGRNGSTLTQPGPQMYTGSKGQGAVVKDSEEGYPNLRFTPDYSWSSTQKTDASFRNAYGYTCVEVSQGKVIYKQNQSADISVYETYIKSLSGSYNRENGYFFAVPVANDVSRMRVVGNGGKPIPVTIHKGSASSLYFVEATRKVYRAEAYVVVKMRANDGRYDFPNLLLVDQLHRVDMLINEDRSQVGNVHVINLSPQRYFYDMAGTFSGESRHSMRPYFGVYTQDVSSGIFTPPVLILSDINLFAEKSFEISVQTTWMLKDD